MTNNIALNNFIHFYDTFFLLILNSYFYHKSTSLKSHIEMTHGLLRISDDTKRETMVFGSPNSYQATHSNHIVHIKMPIHHPFPHIPD